LHEQVAEEVGQPALREGAERREDDEVARAVGQRHVGGRRRRRAVEIAPGPVVVDQRAVAEVLDAHAAQRQHAGQRTDLGQPGELQRQPVHAALQRCAQVR
jgi:hypothetical protein